MALVGCAAQGSVGSITSALPDPHSAQEPFHSRRVAPCEHVSTNGVVSQIGLEAVELSNVGLTWDGSSVASAGYYSEVRRFDSYPFHRRVARALLLSVVGMTVVRLA